MFAAVLALACGLPPQNRLGCPPQNVLALPGGLVAWEVDAFRSVAAGARSGRYRDEDDLWEDLRRRTGDSGAAIRVRNELVFRSNRRRLPTLAAWADAIDELTGAARPAKTSPCSPACTCGCNAGRPCGCGESGTPVGPPGGPFAPPSGFYATPGPSYGPAAPPRVARRAGC